jgi:serine/threonine protein kinase
VGPTDLPPVEEVPAAHLEGRELDDGWRVESLIRREAGATGGHFSVPYEVVHADGRVAFMKALNFHAAADGPGTVADRLKLFASAYVHERDLFVKCGGRKMSHVIRLLGHGEVLVPEAGTLLSRVPYLIFELADGDIRAFQARSAELDCAWAFRVMKHALLGLGQLHASQAAHQDLKPSNVLTQDDGCLMKLGDLGRAETQAGTGPWVNLTCPGALTYAPPEQHYGAFSGTWEERRAADLYLAGSLGVQLFLGHCMSALILKHVASSFQLQSWRGSFQEVLPYLESAHVEIVLALEDDVFQRLAERDSAERFSRAIGQMTAPDPNKRGHPKDRAARTSSFNVQRFVSLMDILTARASYRARDGGLGWLS